MEDTGLALANRSVIIEPDNLIFFCSEKKTLFVIQTSKFGLKSLLFEVKFRIQTQTAVIIWKCLTLFFIKRAKTC